MIVMRGEDIFHHFTFTFNRYEMNGPKNIFIIAIKKNSASNVKTLVSSTTIIKIII